MRIGTRRGDTLIEVMFAIAVFSVIAVISMSLMNMGVSTAQGTLEMTMARNEIDAQAEALRFIQNSYIAEREWPDEKKQFADLWYDIAYREAIEAEELSGYDLDTAEGGCSAAYDTSSETRIFNDNAFVLNTRLLQRNIDGFDWTGKYGGLGSEGSAVTDYDSLRGEIILKSTEVTESSRFREASLYPRIIYNSGGASESSENTDSGDLAESGGDGRRGVRDLYRRIQWVEGIWVIPVKGGEIFSNNEPEYYDFHIRTCWYGAGRNYPYTLGTVVRLYNAEMIEGGGRDDS